MKKTATLGLRLDEDTVDKLGMLATEAGLKASTIARLAIEQYIADARFRGSVSIPIHRSHAVETPAEGAAKEEVRPHRR